MFNNQLGRNLIVFVGRSCDLLIRALAACYNSILFFATNYTDVKLIL